MNKLSMNVLRAIVLGFICTSMGTGCAWTKRVSISSASIEGNSGSYKSSIDSTGRFVAFSSGASNLVTLDTNGVSDIYVHDTATGQTTRVSVNSSGTQGNAASYSPAISGNGRFVAFSSEATNLVPGDTNADPFSNYEVFVHDRTTDQTIRVNVSSTGTQGNRGQSAGARPSISFDGRFVAFSSSASNLVAGDTNSRGDVYVHDLKTGKTTRVSVSSNGAQGNYYSDTPSISSDGRYVTFRSDASNLVPGDTNNVCDTNGDGVFNDNCTDVFVHDRLTKETRIVSINSDGSQANGTNYAGTSGMAISAHGRFIAFNSEASNLVSDDTNGIRDFFVHDTLTKTTQRVSVDSDGNQATSAIYSGASIAISADGQFVAFAFDGPLVSDDAHSTNPDTEIYVRDLKRRTTKIVSISSDGDQAVRPSADPAISASGQYVTFFTAADNLVINDLNTSTDVFLHKQSERLECKYTH